MGGWPGEGDRHYLARLRRRGEEKKRKKLGLDGWMEGEGDRHYLARVRRRCEKEKKRKSLDGQQVGG